MIDESGTDPRALQEYLDGRLSSEQRAAFEARLEREPALRLALESALELRVVLGQEGPELSPGFYTRIRARFEESSREKRWSFRLLSWETAGVAAAAALATALFVPRLMQQGLPEDLGAVATEQQPAVVLDVKENQEPLEESLTREKSLAPAPTPATPKVKREKKGRREGAEAPQRVEQETLGFGDAEKDRLDSPSGQASAPGSSSDKGDRQAGRDRDEGLVAVGSTAGETRRARIPRDDDAFHAAASPEAGSVPPVEVLSESAAAAAARAEEEVVRADLGQHAAGAAQASRPLVVELRAGLVERGQLRSVERIEDWLAILSGSHGETLEMLGSPATNRRLVLIGARGGLACESLTVTSDDRLHRIDWASLPKYREAPGGCALVLPLDDRPVSIASPR